VKLVATAEVSAVVDPLYFQADLARNNGSRSLKSAQNIISTPVMIVQECDFLSAWRLRVPCIDE
jgi:hypothetical protein